VGNGAQEHYQGNFSDPNGDGFHNFAPDDEAVTITLPFLGILEVYLQWNDPWGASGNDYDLLLIDWDTKQVIARSEREQNGDDDPYEDITGYFNLVGRELHLALVIDKSPAAQAKNLCLFVISEDIPKPIEHNVPAGSIANPASAKEALSIGAVDWGKPDTIEPYSSRGPTRDGRLKPELVAPVGVSTTTLKGFRGTSASTPHAAAVAALILECRPEFKPLDVSRTLTSTAIDLGVAGADNTYGYGRVDAYEAIRSIKGPEPPRDLTILKERTKKDALTLQ